MRTVKISGNSVRGVGSFLNSLLGNVREDLPLRIELTVRKLPSDDLERLETLEGTLSYGYVIDGNNPFTAERRYDVNDTKTCPEATQRHEVDKSSGL